MWFTDLFYRPTDECKFRWRDSEFVSFTFWRFMWLKQRPKRFLHHKGEPDELMVHKPDECWMWAYRYIPIYGRLYWCEEWMGTHNSLLPWRGFLLLMIAFLFLLMILFGIIVGAKG